MATVTRDATWNRDGVQGSLTISIDHPSPTKAVLAIAARLAPVLGDLRLDYVSHVNRRTFAALRDSDGATVRVEM
jgi:hypothetical protein